MKKGKAIKLFSLLSLVFILSISGYAQEKLVTKIKIIDTVFSQSNVKEISVFNSFGNVDISRWNEEKLKVVITIKVIAWDKEDAGRFAEKLIPKMELETNKAGNYYFTTTNDLSNIKNLCNCNKKAIVYAPWFKKKAKVKYYSVNYKIYIPSSISIMSVINNFGNMSLPDFDGNLYFFLRNGNLKAGKLKFTKPTMFSQIKYGKARIESLENGKLCLYSCKDVHIGAVLNADIKSEFSKIQIDQCNKLSVRSKSDVFSIGSLTSLDGTGDFSEFTINTLKKSLNLKEKSGLVSVGHINPGFSLIKLNGEYSDYNLNLNNLQFTFDARLNFTDLKCSDDIYPAADKKILQNSSASIVKKIGDNPQNRKVTIECTNCNVRLNEKKE